MYPVKATYPFEIVGIDILGNLRQTPRGNKYILVIIDYYLNWVEAGCLKTITAEELAELTFSFLISRHGWPSKILTDQGTQFFLPLPEFILKSLELKS